MKAYSEQALAPGGPVKVVLLGHSYIRCLGEYAAGIPDGVNLGLSDIQVTYVCQGGMTLRPRAWNRWITDHLTEVTSSCPSSSCSISTWAPCRLVRLREKSSSLPGIFAAITGVLCT